ncbi:MAG: hypothetical protein Ct9H300mP11_26850 [Chloroflexota bacterium]|nr:MAG: hypothetical protein Ct9H300mP11_26850 [Chloroflexota bacterium]
MASVFLGINDRTFTYSFTAGRSEFQGTGFRNPMDFALGPDDLVYVVNRSYESRSDGTRINLFRIGEDKEEYITEFGSYGEEAGQFIWPMSIALDKDTNVYVTDEWTHRVTVYNKDGEYLNHWGIHGQETESLTGHPVSPSALTTRSSLWTAATTEFRSSPLMARS